MASSTLWFDLPGEIRNHIYKWAFQGVNLRPFLNRTSNWPLTVDESSQNPSSSVASLVVSKQWQRELTPILFPNAIFDFTSRPGDPLPSISSNTLAAMRHIVILESHAYSSDWIAQMVDKMPSLRTISIRKAIAANVLNDSSFDGANLAATFVERIKKEPIKALLIGYRFDHLSVMDALKSKDPKGPVRQISLVGKLQVPDGKGTTHSVCQAKVESVIPFQQCEIELIANHLNR